MTKSQHAIRASQNYHLWGRDVAMRYAQHHGVVGLYRLARQLQASYDLIDMANGHQNTFSFEKS